MAPIKNITAILSLLAATALARTDLEGCTYYDSVVVPDHGGAYATRIWYVPDSGELCDFLDCGGGRAPPKTTVPGCPLYKGTETYSPSFIDLKTLGLAPATTTAAAASSGVATSATETEEEATSLITAAPSSTFSTGLHQASSTASEEESESESASAAAAESSKVKTPGAKSSSGGRETSAAPSSTPSSSGSGSGSDSGSDSDSASASSAASTTVSTGAAALPTAAGVIGSCLMVGAAVYGML